MTALNERERKQVKQMLAQTRRDVEAGKLDWADEKARTVAYSLPPSDFASHRAIEAFAAALREVRTTYHASEPDAVAVERAAQFLWALLDDIDTISDMAKGDNVAYREAVEKIQRRRFEVGSADGYRVSFTEPLRPILSTIAED